MSDSDDFFGDLTDRPLVKDYPGERKPMLRDQEKPVRKGGAVATSDLESWDDRPRTYKVGGVDREFFTRRHVALAVNRSVETIKAWQRDGILPPATYRAPNPRQRGKRETGDRLWSREQVLCIIRVAAVCGVLQGKPPTPVFTQEVKNALIELQRSESRTT